MYPCPCSFDLLDLCVYLCVRCLNPPHTHIHTHTHTHSCVIWLSGAILYGHPSHCDPRVSSSHPANCSTQGHVFHPGTCVPSRDMCSTQGHVFHPGTCVPSRDMCSIQGWYMVHECSCVVLSRQSLSGQTNHPSGPLCSSPDEDSCQKFVPFIGVRNLFIW